jgi:hypothetical protein
MRWVLSSALVLSLGIQDTRMNLPDYIEQETWDRIYDKKRRKYVAQIMVDKKNKNLGLFNSAEEAHDAYVKAKRKLHVGCTL